MLVLLFPEIYLGSVMDISWLPDFLSPLSLFPTWRMSASNIFWHAKKVTVCNCYVYLLHFIFYFLILSFHKVFCLFVFYILHIILMGLVWEVKGAINLLSLSQFPHLSSHFFKECLLSCIEIWQSLGGRHTCNKTTK